MGIYAHKRLSDEEANEWLKNLEQWKAGQPKYIAVKMTNAAMCKIIFDPVKAAMLEHTLKFVNTYKNSTHVPGNYKFINGELYEKTLNEKSYPLEVIPWE